MIKKIICLTVILLSGFFSKAQTTEDSIKRVVTNLFKAAFEADSAGVMDCFWPEAIIQTVAPNHIKNEGPLSLAVSFGKLNKGQLDEQILFKMIEIDDYLASVWTPYRLYLNKTFMHCGVDSFQLIRRNGIWKISHLIDTRRKNCN